MISVNKKSQDLVDDLIKNHEYYRVSIKKGYGDCTIVDAGINALGNMEAGRVISEICLGGLGRVHILNTLQNNEWPLTIHVNTNDPVIACLGSQYAGWSLSSKDENSKFNALGSGPARSLALKEPLFKDINYSDKSKRTSLVMEVDSFPPDDVIEKISNDTKVDTKNLTIIITPINPKPTVSHLLIPMSSSRKIFDKTVTKKGLVKKRDVAMAKGILANAT